MFITISHIKNTCQMKHDWFFVKCKSRFYWTERVLKSISWVVDDWKFRWFPVLLNCRLWSALFSPTAISYQNLLSGTMLRWGLNFKEREIFCPTVSECVAALMNVVSKNARIALFDRKTEKLIFENIKLS